MIEQKEFGIKSYWHKLWVIFKSGFIDVNIVSLIPYLEPTCHILSYTNMQYYILPYCYSNIYTDEIAEEKKKVNLGLIAMDCHFCLGEMSKRTQDGT